MGFDPAKTERVDTSEYSQLGKEFFDPNSLRNRGMYNNLKNMGIDSAAQQYLGGMRSQAQGQNPFASEQQRSNMANATGSAQNAFMQYMNNAHGTGSGLMGMSLQGNMANAQAQNQANQVASQNRSQFFGGLLGAATQAMPGFLFGTGIGGVGKLMQAEPNRPANFDTSGSKSWYSGQPVDYSIYGR